MRNTFAHSISVRILKAPEAEGGRAVAAGVGLEWHNPVGCDTSACVQTARDDEFVYVRHSTEPDGPILRFTYAEWTTFERGIIIEAQTSS